MLVTSFGGAHCAEAYVVDDIVGLSVAVVVEVRAAVARSRGAAAGAAVCVAVRNAYSGVHPACLRGRRRSRRLDLWHIAGIETSNGWTTLRGFRRWREGDSGLIALSAGAGSRIVPLRSERRTIVGFAPPRPS